jgi:phage terminase large subunit-like protein
MKIIILDDDGSTLYEQDDPGYIHLPIICDGKFDMNCDEDDCPDPRCVERRAEAERLLEGWTRSGQDLGFYYHLPPGSSEKDMEGYDKLPNSDRKIPAKVKVQSYTRNELVLGTGERLKFFLPAVNVYSSHQVMFSTDEWEASLSPWDEVREERARARTADNGAVQLAKG